MANSPISTLPNELSQQISNYCGIYSLFLRFTCKSLASAIPVNSYFVDNQARLLLNLKDLHCLKCIFENNYFFPMDNVFNLKLIEEIGKAGSIEILESFRKRQLADCFSSAVFSEAATMHGHLNLLKYAKQQGFLHKGTICKTAAKYGHFEILKWAVSNKFPDYKDKNICTAAAVGGHLEILKWCRDKNIPWDDDVYIGAARENHFGVLIWAYKNNCPKRVEAHPLFSSNSDILKLYSTNPDILKWLHKKNFHIADSVMEDVATEGNLQTLKWLRDIGKTLNKKVFQTAVKHKHFEIMEWLKENKCPWTETACSAAASNGDLETLKWLRENNCPWDDDVYNFAARRGCLEVIEWVHQCGLSFNDDMCQTAAIHGHLNVIEWAVKNGYQLDDKVHDNATSKGHLHIIQWIVENGFTLSKNVWNRAILNGHLSILTWLADKHQLDTYTFGSIGDNYEILRWIIKNNYQLNEKIFHEALSNNNIRILKIFKDSNPSHQFSSSITAKILAHNHYSVFKYAIRYNLISISTYLEKKNLYAKAIRKGHLNVLIYLRIHKYPWTESLCEKALIWNKNDIFKWLINNRYPISLREYKIVKKKLDRDGKKILYGGFYTWSTLFYELIHGFRKMFIDILRECGICGALFAMFLILLVLGALLFLCLRVFRLM